MQIYNISINYICYIFCVTFLFCKSWTLTVGAMQPSLFNCLCSTASVQLSLPNRLCSTVSDICTASVISKLLFLIVSGSDYSESSNRLEYSILFIISFSLGALPFIPLLFISILFNSRDL